MKPLGVQERLRLFRYGLIVVVVVTFLVSLLTPFVALSGVAFGGVTPPPITDGLGTAVLFTVVVAVLCVIAYFAYRAILMRSVKSE
jgi:hypothetical protein